MVLIFDEESKARKVCTWCFRPLAGIMVLITLTTEYEQGETSVVSVPLRGLWFLSGKEIKGRRNYV